MCNRAMQHITSENCNVVDLPIYLFSYYKNLWTVRKVILKTLVCQVAAPLNSRGRYPTGGNKKYRLQKHLVTSEKLSVVVVVAVF